MDNSPMIGNNFYSRKIKIFKKKLKNICKKEVLLNLPNEVKLDILKFLSFNQLTSVQQTNYHFYCLIRQNERILACRGLYSVEILEEKSDENSDENYKVIDEDFQIYITKSGIFNIPLDNQPINKWQSAVDRQLPIYLSTCNIPPKRELFTFINKGLVKDYKKMSKYYYVLELPAYPKNIKEMKIVRCWLETLFLSTFELVDFREYFFNPEMIKILFDKEENIPLQFRARNGTLTYCNHNIENVLKFKLDHLIITDDLEIEFKCLDKEN
uniref:F-box domain-containing protein n=1 Tax=Meloidogyne enterolobii TaxID=390850 RepID=A0A6V7WZ50_MELEN|nr:unnamed protein product [Meloidogyne enterolobii]